MIHTVPALAQLVELVISCHCFPPITHALLASIAVGGASFGGIMYHGYKDNEWKYKLLELMTTGQRFLTLFMMIISGLVIFMIGSQVNTLIAAVEGCLLPDMHNLFQLFHLAIESTK